MKLTPEDINFSIPDLTMLEPQEKHVESKQNWISNQ
jgi:hypothetical protein